ncbi:MAG: hypothetical protein H0U57_01005 [Tatlockia sp.]|nr:hypothetical protein [Tatlockia sp.]
MSKVKIYIKTDVNDDTNKIFLMMQEAHPEYEIELMDCAKIFIGPNDRPSLMTNPLHLGSVYYHYDTSSTNNSADLAKLELFAAEFERKLKNQLKNSDLKDRLVKDKYDEVISSAYKFDGKLNHPQANNFFQTPNRSFSPRVKTELTGALICGLIALPLFFFEPYTASMLLFCAAVLILVALSHNKQDKELEASAHLAF